MNVLRAPLAALSLVVLVVVSCSSSGGSDELSTAIATQAQEGQQTPGSEIPPTPANDTPEVVAAGEFEKIGYAGSGTAELLETERGTQVRFSNFEVEQGPALRVYLSAAKAGSPEKRYDDDFVDLGELEAFDGDQSYDVPAGTPETVLRSVVIWCAEFSVGFVVAPLDPA